MHVYNKQFTVEFHYCIKDKEVHVTETSFCMTEFVFFAISFFLNNLSQRAYKLETDFFSFSTPGKRIVSKKTKLYNF